MLKTLFIKIVEKFPFLIQKQKIICWIDREVGIINFSQDKVSKYNRFCYSLLFLCSKNNIMPTLKQGQKCYYSYLLGGVLVSLMSTIFLTPNGWLILKLMGYFTYLYMVICLLFSFTYFGLWLKYISIKHQLPNK